jgi:tetratricopeptide (TPR) repeat protein/CHAT domain-containing protein
MSGEIMSYLSKAHCNTRVLAVVLACAASPLAGRADEHVAEPSAQAVSDDKQATKLMRRDQLCEEAEKLSTAGKHAEAIEIAEEVLAIEVAVFGEADAEVAGTLRWIGGLHMACEEFDDAVSAYERRERVLEALPGVAEWQVADARQDLAQAKWHRDATPEQRSELRRAEELSDAGFASYQKGSYEAALKSNREALAIVRAILGEKHLLTASALAGVGALLKATGEYADARPYYEQALAICREVLGEEHPRTADSLDNLGVLLHETGDLVAAKSCLEQALAIRRKVFGKEHPDLAASLNNLGGLLEETGDYAAARPYYEEALAICRKTLGEDHPWTASSLGNLGVLLSHMGDYAAARPYYEEALAIKRKILGKEHPDTAISLDNLGVLLQKMGDYVAAKSYFEQALEVRRKALGEKHPDTANSLSNLGALLRKTGDYAAARPYYERALAIRRKVYGEEHPSTATSLNNLGVLLGETGDYAAARLCYEQALAIRRKVLGEQHPDTASSIYGLGVLLQMTGDYPAARSHYEQALAIRREVLGKSHPVVAESLNALGVLHKATKDFAAARRCFEQALAIRVETLGEEHSDTARTLSDLSIMLSDAGDYSAARPYCERALAIRRKVFGEEHPETAESLITLGALLHLTGDYAAARPYYEQALAIRRKILGEKQLATAAAYNYLACLLAASGDSEGAWGQFLAEVDAQQGVLERELASLSDAKLALFLQQMADAQSYIVQLTDEDSRRQEETARIILSRKAVSFEVMQRRRSAERLLASTPAVADLQRQFLAVQRAMEDLAMRTPSDVKSGELAARRLELRNESNRLADRLALAFAEPLSAGAPLSVSALDVRTHLSAEQALLEFVKFRRFDFQERKKTSHWKEDRYAALVVRPGSPTSSRLIDLGPAAEIDALVGEVSRQVREYQRAGAAREDEASYEEDYCEVAGRLYAKLFAPLKSALGNAKQIYLGPDSRLHEIPFESLVDGSGKYLIETDYRFAYVNSGRDLLREEATEAGAGVFVFAGPNYDLGAEGRFAALQRDSPRDAATLASDATEPQLLASASPILRSTDTRLGWRRLPGADLEGEDAAAAFSTGSWGEVRTFTGDDALEDLVKQVDKPRVLVFVTHGDFLEDQPDVAASPDGARSFGELDMDRGFAELRGGAGLARAGLRSTEDPLLRSYLLLAGANKIDEPLPAGSRLDNGWLTAQEIAELDLRGTDLVVLSACNTSRGQADNGQAVTGMRSAFLFAGARTIVGSLYEVPNAETRQLMKPFYEGVAAGKGKLASLSAAKLDFIKRRRQESGAAHPFYWASFVLVGEP